MLKRRCNSKFMSNAICLELASLNSPLKAKYLKTLKCGIEVRQEGVELRSMYCGARWCLTCNRIRTSKLLEKYGQIVDCLKDPHFVTLTVRNIAPDMQNLKMYQREMFKHHRKVQDLLRKYGITIKGVKKYEAIPDKDINGLRPHFHWLIDGTITEKQLRQVWYNQKLPLSWSVDRRKVYFERELRAGKLAMLKGEMLIQIWLKRHEGISDRAGQHVTPATPGTAKELFKYTTKVVVKNRRDEDITPLRLLDMIYQATERVRTITVTGFVTVNPRKPEIVKAVTNGLTFVNLHLNWHQVNRLVSVFCPQVYKHSGPVPIPAESAKQILKITNYKRKLFEYLIYKEFTEIVEAPISENLEVQGYADLAPASTVYAWHNDNWYDIVTHQPLTTWQISIKTARFIESFYYG